VPAENRPCILIIDDDERVLQTVSLILEFEHFQAECALTAVAGLELAGKLKPDAILLDLMLPDLPGTVVMKSLKQNPETASIPVFLFTANEADADEESLSSSEGVIPKPFDAEQMVASLKECLAGLEKRV